MDTGERLVWVRRLAVTVVVMTFALMVVGSWVKATGSGLSCPDWPACYGQWLPPFPSIENGGIDPATGEPVSYTQAQILYEWAHRALASILGIPFFAFVIMTWRGREFNPLLRQLPMTALVVLGIQVLLGGGTVIQGNPAPLTTAHLATATLFFFLVASALWVAYLKPMATPEPAKSKAPAPHPTVVFPGEETDNA